MSFWLPVWSNGSRIAMAKPRRYFAGRAPAAESDSDDEDASVRREQGVALRRRKVAAKVVVPPETAAPDTEPAPRRAPLPKRGAEGFVPVRSLGTVVEVAPSGLPSVSPSQSHDSYDSYDSGSESESPSESEESTGVSEGEEAARLQELARLRPVFKRREERVVESELEKRAEEERIAEEREEERCRARKLAAKDIVTAVIQQDDDAELNGNAGGAGVRLPDDEDKESDRDAEFALWKVRELLRIKRERDAEAARKAGAPTGGSVAERRETAVDAASADVVGSDCQPAGDGGRKGPGYLQKFYKMGPFFLERGEDGQYAEPIYNRDYNQGTAEDNINRKALPQPLQVRRGQLGKAGQSKYTHLGDMDTAASLAREMREDTELRENLSKLDRSNKSSSGI